MEERSLDERLVAVRGFFDDAAWNAMGAVERTRQANIFDNFRIMQGLGLTEGKPDFVVEFEKRLQAARLKEGAKLAGGERKRKAAAVDCAVVDERSPPERVVCLVHRLLSVAARQMGRVLLGLPVEAPRRKRVCRRPSPVVEAAATSEGAAVERYPRRARKTVNYADFLRDDDDAAADDSDDEEELPEAVYCFGCKKHISGGCQKHKMVFVRDQSGVVQGKADYARLSCPGMLSVSPSLIDGDGVWADHIIPAGHCFGPYKGVRVLDAKEADKSGYSWQIGLAKNGDRFFVDGHSEKHGNWMRFVNHASASALSDWLEGVGRSAVKHKRNVYAFEMDRQIWYVATEDIRLGVELYVGYGIHYARYLNSLVKQVVVPPVDLSKVFACKKCKDGFSSAALLDAHVARRHPTEPKAARKQAAASSAEKTHRCPSCAYATNHLGHLRDHERVHSGERPFKCAQCPAAFTDAGNLGRHSRTHTGERPFACTDCGRTFSDKSVLNSHRRIHEGVKAFKCDYCSKRFTQSHHLTVHLRVHTGAKPYACSFCDKNFSHSSDCRRHEKSHHS